MSVLLLATTVLAATPPAPGAVALPAGAELTLPYPAGVQVRVSCGYGPSCSAFHSGTDDTCCTNDHHALDLVRDELGGGDGEPVVAAADGTVVYADWAGRGWSTFGRLVLIEHDFGDGHTYMSAYAHLSSLSVGVGEVVTRKEEIGTQGGSGNYVDGWFGSHVHFSVYRDASFTLGPYGGLSVVPEAIDGYEDLVAGDVLTSLDADSVILTVDDQDPEFTLAGPATDHTSGGYGVDAHFYWEPAVAAGLQTTFGSWQPDVPEVGVYKVQAFIPYSDNATATMAPFTIHAHGELASTTQDQSIIGGDFHDLWGGRGFKFVAGLHGMVELHNGSDDSSDAHVAFDAIRWVKVDDVGPALDGDACLDSTECSGDLLCDGSTCRPPCWEEACAPEGVCDDTTGLCDVWPEDAATPGTTTDPGTTPPTTSGTDPGTTDDPGTLTPPVRDDLPSDRQEVSGVMGCGCASGGAPAVPGAAVLVLLWLARRPRTATRTAWPRVRAAD